MNFDPVIFLEATYNECYSGLIKIQFDSCTTDLAILIVCILHLLGTFVFYLYAGSFDIFSAVTVLLLKPDKGFMAIIQVNLC